MSNIQSVEFEFNNGRTGIFFCNGVPIKQGKNSVNKNQFIKLKQDSRFKKWEQEGNLKVVAETSEKQQTNEEIVSEKE